MRERKSCREGARGDDGSGTTVLNKIAYGIGTLTTANFTGSVDRPVRSAVRSEPLRV